MGRSVLVDEGERLMPGRSVLNATYEPLCVVPMRRAVVLVLAEKAFVVEAGDELHALGAHQRPGARRWFGWPATYGCPTAARCR